ncbi:hypothetical protein [Salinarimonas soli]|uniref:hypothetical protein n=1 Tax=Salinarimonas soli TaxID=1638099 RepID=UPI001661CFD4|nr:hypothetical protein [Salinarimonas soli]
MQPLPSLAPDVESAASNGGGRRREMVQRVTVTLAGQHLATAQRVVRSTRSHAARGFVA